MKKDLNLVHNVIFLLEELYQYLDNRELFQYDDSEEMELAKKEVLKILDNLIKRRENALQRG